MICQLKRIAVAGLVLLSLAGSLVMAQQTTGNRRPQGRPVHAGMPAALVAAEGSSRTAAEQCAAGGNRRAGVPHYWGPRPEEV